MNIRNITEDQSAAERFLHAYWLSQENPSREDLAVAALDILAENTAAIKDYVPKILDSTFPTQQSEKRLQGMFDGLAKRAPGKAEELTQLGYSDLFTAKKRFWKFF